MVYGTDVSGVFYTRSQVNKRQAGTPTRAARAEAATSKGQEADLNVEAHFDGVVYTLVVEAAEQRATVTDVLPVELADELARVIKACTEAYGDLDKNRRMNSMYGVNTPTANRDALRFG